MSGTPRSRCTALAVVAVVVALSAWLVLGGRPTVHPEVVHQSSTQSAPDRLANSLAGSVDVVDVAVSDATRVPPAGTSSFEVWALPACLAAMLALLVFRQRKDTAPGRRIQFVWLGAVSRRAPPCGQFA